MSDIFPPTSDPFAPDITILLATGSINQGRFLKMGVTIGEGRSCLRFPSGDLTTLRVKLLLIVPLLIVDRSKGLGKKRPTERCAYHRFFKN